MNISAILHTGVVFIALSAASMGLVFSILFFRVPSLTFFLVVFLLTYAVYGMDRLTSLQEDLLSHPERTHFLQRNRWPFAMSLVLAFSGSLLLATSSGWIAALIPIAPLAVMFYSGKLPRKLFGARRSHLKEHFVVKNVCIASGWAFLLFVASMYLGRPMEVGAWIFLIPLLMKLFVMASAYDFKDINSDRKSVVRTLPIVMGEDSSKVVLHILNALATVLILCLVYFGLIPLLGIIFVPAFIYQLLMIHLVRKDAPAWVYYIVCDLEQFFWLVFLGIGGWLIGHP